MAVKTYIPTLIILLRRICVYVVRWDAIIRENLPEGALPAYEAFKLACDALLVELED